MFKLKLDYINATSLVRFIVLFYACFVFAKYGCLLSQLKNKNYPKSLSGVLYGLLWLYFTIMFQFFLSNGEANFNKPNCNLPHSRWELHKVNRFATEYHIQTAIIYNTAIASHLAIEPLQMLYHLSIYQNLEKCCTERDRHQHH